jgi:hypothetical protein
VKVELLEVEVPDKTQSSVTFTLKTDSWHSLGGRGISSANSDARTVSAFVDKNDLRPNFAAFSFSEYEILREQFILTHILLSFELFLSVTVELKYTLYWN